MGKMLIIILLGASVIFTSFDLMNIQSDARMIDSVFTYYNRTQARNLAASGIELAIKDLAQNVNWSGDTINSFDSGTLMITAASSNSDYFNGTNQGFTNRVLIRATGIVGGERSQINAVVRIGTGGGVPQFMAFALASEGTMTMNGNINITDDGNSSWNSSIHTNSNLQINGNNTVNGFGTYSGSALCNPWWRLDTTFDPNDNPSGGPTQYQAPRVEIPTFDPNDYVSQATNTYNGNLTLSGNRTLGTRENPVIYYVNGDLQLSGRFTGYGTFIVKGNILVTGNVEINSGGNDESTLGLYAQGDINFHGNPTVYAQLLSNSNINFSGNSELHGTATAKGLFNFNGNVDIFYRPASDALSSPFWPGTTVNYPILRSYYE